jgi:O-antigen/teichoic acid export membrane protein
MKRTSVWHWVRRAEDLAALRLGSDALTKARISRLGWEGFWVVLGQAMAVVGAVVGVRVLTELLPPEVYGELALAMTGATLLNQVVFGPISNGASRFYAVAQEAGDIPTYLLAVKRLALVVTGWVMTAAAPVAALLLLTGHDRWLGLLLAVLGFALLSGYNGILDAIQNAARQRLVVAWHQGLAPWGRFLVAAGMIVLLGASSTVAMVGFVIALLLVLSSQGWFLARSTREARCKTGLWQSTVPSWRARLASYSWPFAAWGWLTWLQLVSDRWALGLFATTEQVGQYAVLYQLGYYPMMLALGMVLQLTGPVLFQRAGAAQDPVRLQASKRLSRSLAFWTAVTTIGLSGLLAVSHRQIFALLVNEQYKGTSGLLPWMVFAGGLFATGQVLSLECHIAFETRSLVVPKVVTSILGVGLNLIGASLAGVAGVVTTSVLWAVIYVVAIAGLVIRESKWAQEVRRNGRG